MVGGIALQGGMHSNEGVVRGCGIARLHRVASAAAAKRKQPAEKGFGAAAGNTQGNDDKGQTKGRSAKRHQSKRVTCQRHNMGHMSQGSSLGFCNFCYGLAVQM